jgi:hypothetical protein
VAHGFVHTRPRIPGASMRVLVRSTEFTRVLAFAVQPPSGIRLGRVLKRFPMFSAAAT